MNFIVLIENMLNNKILVFFNNFYIIPQNNQKITAIIDVDNNDI